MKERLETAEKSLLLLIPCLVVLSLAYYWGYWGYFGIDAISYYGVQDLIKGFAYALPAVVLLGIAFIIINKALDLYIAMIRKRFGKVAGPVLAGLPYVLFFVLYFSDFLPEAAENWLGPTEAAILIITLLDIVLTVLGSHWEWTADNAVSFFLIKWLVLFCIISFVSSYIYGKKEAENIAENRHFSYTQLSIRPDSANIKTTFKYLGKAGDYYFFISPDNEEKRIVTVQTMPTLVLHDYNKDDSISVRTYRKLVKHK